MNTDKAEPNGGSSAPTLNVEPATCVGDSAQANGELLARSGETAGVQIGPYKLLEKIGEGGFGTVWLAEQREPVKRRVALKIIKPGMDTDQVIARFEVERQALAMMDHPNIARVFDAAATGNGRPYFVMELVRGISLIDYCEREKLDTRARLRLFVQVCHAIQHAHQKGVIHRDIKPGNVLVTQHDDAPLVKVIDFGIAKATSAALTEKTLFTQQDQIIGTPVYMSPEQAEGSGLDIDTRTDVYSLGVLLYELLTNTTPFSAKELISKGYHEMLRIVREVEPPRPSVRVSTLDGTTTARRGPIDTRALASQLSGDLDWIALKCLEKDRARRYDTANALADDVMRHLNGEAVVAAPPSRIYRMRKFARRHWAGALATGLVALALIAGMSGTLWQAQRARAAETEMRRRADDLEKVARFQENLIAGIDAQKMGENLRQSLLEAAGQENRAALETAFARVNFIDIARKSLDRNIFQGALTAIEDQFDSQPLIKARLLETVASSLGNLGLLDRAMAPLDKALQIRRREQGDLHRETLALIDFKSTLLSLEEKPAEAEPYAREALAGRRRALGNADPDTLDSISVLGGLLIQQGKLAEAEPLMRESLEGFRRIKGDTDSRTLSALADMGNLLSWQNRDAEALPYFRKAFEGQRRLHGDADPATLIDKDLLGVALQALGKLDEAEPMLSEALEGLRRAKGNDHPDTALAIARMADQRLLQGRLAESETYRRESVEARRRVSGEDDPRTLKEQSLLAQVFWKQGKLAEAESAYRMVLTTRRRVLGDNHADTASVLGNLGLVLRDMKRYAEAEKDALEAQDILTKSLGPAHPRTIDNEKVLVELYVAWNAAEPGKGYGAKADEWRARLQK
jgi:serine/threonine protein kinase